MRSTALCAAFVASCSLAAPALAQVSTFTRDGWIGAPALASTREAPVARLYQGSTHINAHPDASPGVARALERPNFTDRGSPADFGAPASLEGIALTTNIGPTLVRVDPWTPILGGGHRRTLEADRAAWLERAGFVGGVRTHVNQVATTGDEPEPRGVIRVRPRGDDDDTTDERFVLRRDD